MACWLESAAYKIATERASDVTRPPLQKLRALRAAYELQERNWAIAEAVAALWQSFDPRVRYYRNMPPPAPRETLFNLWSRVHPADDGTASPSQRAERSASEIERAIAAAHRGKGPKNKACAAVGVIVDATTKYVRNVFDGIRANEARGAFLPKRPENEDT